MESRYYIYAICLNIKKHILSLIYCFKGLLQLEKIAQSHLRTTFWLCISSPLQAALVLSPTDACWKPEEIEKCLKLSIAISYILHGGNLIYEIGNWKKQAIFQQIATQCTDCYT